MYCAEPQKVPDVSVMTITDLSCKVSPHSNRSLIMLRTGSMGTEVKMHRHHMR